MATGAGGGAVWGSMADTTKDATKPLVVVVNASGAIVQRSAPGQGLPGQQGVVESHTLVRALRAMRENKQVGAGVTPFLPDQCWSWEVSKTRTLFCSNYQSRHDAQLPLCLQMSGTPSVLHQAHISMLFKSAKASVSIPFIVDCQVAAVVVRINSPGGSAVASDVIARELALMRAAGKPVIASMGDVAASGGYYIAGGLLSCIAGCRWLKTLHLFINRVSDGCKGLG